MNLTGEYVLMSKKLFPSLKADILIIDDTPDNLRLLNQMLSQHYKVRLAPSGDIGLKAVLSAPPDLILLDVMMSGMNGYEVADQLKADEQTAEIPIIFISALDNTESKVLGFTAGGVDYITKPFQEKEVLARVYTHLSLRALYLQAQKEIVERKRAEESLRKREQEYKTLVENTPDVIARFDRQYRHTYVNPVVEKEFGVLPATLLGKSHRELGQPSEAADWSENIIRQVFETGQEVVFELTVPTPAGNKYYLSRGVPEFAEDGSVISALIIHRNITVRKQAEEHVRQLSRAVEASPTSIVITDTKGDIQYVNPKFTEVTGYSFSEALGKNPRILKSDQTPSEVHSELWGTIPKGKEWHGEFCNRKKNGELYWESASISPITDGNGIITHYVAVKEDITERKQMEETLRESQSLYHSLVEVSPLSICRKDMEGRFTFANRRFLELSQTTLADLVGKTDYDLHPSELAEKYRRDDQAVIESGQVQELIEERAVLGSETVVVQSIKTPIYDGAGRVNGIQISFWDITERKRMEDALLLANEELNQRMAEIEKLQFILQEQAIHDQLTGLFNRRYMEEALTREYARAMRSKAPLSIVMIDLDGLKKFNDTYGHDVGDQAIKIFADQLKLITRKEDVACRYGGDEFLVILYNTNAENATKRVEEWRKKMRNVSIPYHSRNLHISFSAGVATYPIHGESIEATVKAADEALYRQKGT
jgi:diguanylate cyclase (GGDEF)-like protein/PAS domain S-box-containing protein